MVGVSKWSFPFGAKGLFSGAFVNVSFRERFKKLTFKRGLGVSFHVLDTASCKFSGVTWIPSPQVPPSLQHPLTQLSCPMVSHGVWTARRLFWSIWVGFFLKRRSCGRFHHEIWLRTNPSPQWHPMTSRTSQNPQILIGLIMEWEVHLFGI